MTFLLFTEMHSPRHWKKYKRDDDISPFIESATNFLSSITKEGGNVSVESKNKAVPQLQEGLQQDKVVTFATSMVSDLQQFDDEHFAMAKMFISKAVYDVFVKQKEAKKKIKITQSDTLKR